MNKANVIKGKLAGTHYDINLAYYAHVYQLASIKCPKTSHFACASDLRVDNFTTSTLIGNTIGYPANKIRADFLKIFNILKTIFLWLKYLTF